MLVVVIMALLLSTTTALALKRSLPSRSLSSSLSKLSISSQSLASRSFSSSTSLRMFQSKQEDTKVGDALVNVNLMKSLELTDANGIKKKLGDVMGNGKSVVVFLRHLGIRYPKNSYLISLYKSNYYYLSLQD